MLETADTIDVICTISNFSSALPLRKINVIANITASITNSWATLIYSIKLNADTVVASTAIIRIITGSPAFLALTPK